MNWIDIRNVNNNTPIYDVAWLDNTRIQGDMLFSEISGVSRESINWTDKDPALGNTYRHRYSGAYYTWTNSSQYDGDDGYVGSEGYGIAVRDEARDTLSTITISGSTYRDLGLQYWQGWMPVYNPYMDISTYLSPGQVMVDLEARDLPSSALTNQNIVSAYVGSIEVEKMYLGTDEVWSGSEPGPEEPCAGMEAEIADCEGRGGVWDYDNCFCNEPAPEPTCMDECAGDPECECYCQGPDWYWNTDTQTCEHYEDDDPCGGDPECECMQMGGEWNGEECIMPEPEPVEEPEEPEE